MTNCFEGYFLNPLEQFSIFSVKACLTSNFTTSLIIHTFIIFGSLYFAQTKIMLSNGSQWVWFKIIDLIKGSYYKNTQLKISSYIPLFLFLFIFILFNNLFGLIPFSYAITSSLALNFYIILSIFSMINIIGIIYHKWNFFNIFMPKGLPLTFTWFIIFFETVSYIARVFSLTIRLFANILSGHILQHILITFTYKLFFIKGIGQLIFIIPWVITFLVTILEIAIGFLQAYVLLILILIYFGNTINLH